jgi:flagellar hook-basal body complex protein FliE
VSGVENIAAVQFIPPGTDAVALAYAPDDEVGPLQKPGNAPGFGSVFGDEVRRLDDTLKKAETQSLLLAAGQAESLHSVMLAAEQARISFQLALQVRNKLLDALQEVQRMQL